MSRNKDAVRLAEVKGVAYAAALGLIREAHAQSEGESHHVVAVRLIEAEEARLAAAPVRDRSEGLFQEPKIG